MSRAVFTASGLWSSRSLTVACPDFTHATNSSRSNSQQRDPGGRYRGIERFWYTQDLDLRKNVAASASVSNGMRESLPRSLYPAVLAPKRHHCSYSGEAASTTT